MEAKKRMLCRANAGEKRGEAGTEKKAGKGMLTHVTRAVACEHPSLGLIVHFFLSTLLHTSGILLPFVSATDIYPTMRFEDKDEQQQLRGRLEEWIYFACRRKCEIKLIPISHPLRPIYYNMIFCLKRIFSLFISNLCRKSLYNRDRDRE